MEEEGHDGPFTVWEMFNEATNVLFESLEHAAAADGLDRLLTSILNLSRDSSEVFVPRPGVSKCPDSYYCAFNTWLIGRLFYVGSVKELQRIHVISKDAQLKILSILCTNGASFYGKIYSEYFTVLLKLLKYYHDYSECNNLEITLENFTTEEVHITNVVINLEPIYVKVNDLSTCKTLINLNLQLISESLPHSLLCYRTGLEENLLDKVLHAIKNYSTDIKLVGLKFFINLITNINKVSVHEFQVDFSSNYKDLLFCIKALVQSSNILYDKGEIGNMLLVDFNWVYLELLKLIGSNLKIEHEKDIAEICMVILNKTSNKIFNKELKLLCLSMTKKLKLDDNVLNITEMDYSEINTVSDYYCHEIMESIHNDRSEVKKTNLCKSLQYNKVISVIMSVVKICEEFNIDIFLINHHLQRCISSLGILEKVKLEISNKEAEINLINRQDVKTIYATLTRIIKQNKIVITNNNTSIDLIMNIIVSTVSLQNDFAGDNMNNLFQIICLQDSLMFTEQHLVFTNAVKFKILKYLLIIKLIVKSAVLSKWNKIITYLYVFLMSHKDTALLNQIVEIGPLLIVNKEISASKLIGEILMPVFMSKEENAQSNVLRILPAIACISLGSCNIVKTTSNSEGQEIFNNVNLSICVVCNKCNNDIENKYTVLQTETELLQLTHTSLSGLQSLFVKFINLKNIKFGKGYWNLVKTLCNHYFIFDYGVSTDIINNQYLDDVLDTFKPFMDTQHNKHQEWMSNRDNIINLCVNLLVESTRTSLENNDYNGQTHTLTCIKSLGLCRNEKLILPVTKLFIYFIMHPQCSLAPKAIVNLKEVCEFQELTPNQVYHRYKKDCCKLFVECSLYNGKDFAIFLLKVVRAFGFVGYRDFISKDIHHFLPYLIPYSVTVKQVPSMIEEIAALVQCSVSDFLIERFPYMYVHIYLTESKDTAKKCYGIIERLTKTSTLNLINKHFTVILTEFLLQYCCNPQEVLNACKYLACHDPDASTFHGSMTMSTTQVADFLNPKFLGVLAHFDRKLVNAKVALSVKRKALRSFPEIMQLMGTKYLTPLRFKILATLRSALPLAKEFPDILAEAWQSFIHHIDSISLGPMLSNLAIPLLHQFEYAPKEINSAFQYLILKNENLLSSHISDLFFVVDSNICNQVKMVIKKHVLRSQPDSFQDKIKWYLQHLSHDIPKIKENVFCHMDKLLKNNRIEIHKAIFEGKTIEGVIVELIDAILIGCKDANPEVSLASGSCLGQLGAIEAGHLPRQYVQPDRSPFAFSINDDCFAATALSELARAFQYEKDTRNMDCYALTIQEILKIYEISPSGSKKEVWDSFPENMHQIMFPLLSSRYTLAYPSQPKKAHPLFGSTYATNFLDWAHNWSGQLIPLVQSVSTRALLCAVQPSMRRDPRTLFLFLPYVLLHAVMSGDVQYIREEILAVIGGEKIDGHSVVSTDRSKYKILRHIRMTPNINSTQSEEGNQSKCSKTVYTLFDFLNRWLLEWTHVKQKPLENENYKSIKKFMDTFDKLAIARGNYACGELERALQYLEMYMDEDTDRIQDQLPFLAEIYALLDEPDSIAGILSIQRSEPSLQQLVLTQVVTGRLQDAALCYERLAQHGQLDAHSLQGMTDCYLALDQPFTALRLLSQRDRGELGAEPLWRLGRFEQLQDLAAADVPSSRENWGLLMGRILLAYRKRDRDIFNLTCDNAMNKLLIQMDGESQGENALRNGYQSVLGLHIIKEVQHAEEVLRRLKSLQDGNEQSTEIINTLLSEWRLRLAVVQSDVRTIEPLLRLRRILLQQTQELLKPTHAITSGKLTACIGDLWLQSAKHARKAGIFQQSYMYILNAEEYKPEGLFIEKAKTYWSRCQHEPAFRALRRGLDEAFPRTDDLTQAQRKICAKAKLLIAKYNDETTNVDVDVNIGYYKESVEAFNKWEKSLVCLGAYYEKVSANDTNPGTMWSRRLYALNSYGKALQYGHKYLYQSMPRMLSIWLDVDVTVGDTNADAIVTQMTEVIKTYAERLPIYLYFTAFSQIVSRICHPKKEVYLQLKAIIVRLVAAYPQPALWMMLCVMQSGSAARRERCGAVLSDARLQAPVLRRLVRDYRRLADGLIELCNKPIAGKATVGYFNVTWMMLCVMQSGSAARRERCGAVLSDARLQAPVLRRLVRDYRRLADGLIELCNKPIAGKATVGYFNVTWMMLCVMQSGSAARRERCGAVLSDARLQAPVLRRLVRDYRRLADGLIELCNKPIAGKATVGYFNVTWMMLCVMQSGSAARRERCGAVLSDARLQAPVLRRLVRDYRRLADGLIELCNKPIAGKATVGYFNVTWMMLCVMQSGSAARRERCGAVLSDARLQAPVLRRLVRDYRRLADGLIELCNKPIAGKATVGYFNVTWMMLCVMQSGSAARRERCGAVLSDARLQAPVLRRLVRDYRRLADGLIELCNKPIAGKATVGYFNVTWMMLCVMQSGSAARRERCGAVLSDARLQAPVLRRLVRDYRRLADGLIELCNKPIAGKATVGYFNVTWMMLCVMQSGSAARRERCGAVLSDARLQAPVLRRLVRDYRRLADGLIELCNKPIAGKATTTTVSSLVKTLPHLLSSSDFSHIMMPFEEFCKIVLPSKASSDTPFNIPTEPAVYIAGIKEQVTRLPSLQQPRKVTLIGSNGKSYIIMLKPKDDLRKDFRLMEFNGVVNKFLQDAPETRKRRLYIRTYSVFPLNEECGLIEWVPNLLGLRPILIHIYKQKDIHTSNSELKNKMMCSSKDSVQKKRDIYERLLLPRHPPVFQEWFRKTFSDPYGWYQARSAYIRTTAVMSIVGYILGLGDRHGENVSFDSTNGDTVHVDFNCLFNKGEGFEWPERVPFRLTHNMEAAMGPLGREGTYRKCCEAVARALRAQAAALMSVVGPFVYDPLVAWSRRPEAGERTNPQARLHLEHILRRLRGTVKNKNTESSVSLSPEGLVEHLIAEATSIDNLCQMYIGWGPFL